MFQLHGFMVINALINNQLNKVSILGELSPRSRSYSREVGYYTDNTHTGVRLVTFYSVNDNTPTPLEQNYAQEVIALGAWLAQEALVNKITADKNEFTQKIAAEYTGRINVKEIGKMIHDGKYYLPEYITFTLLSDNRENRYKIWFCDESFQHQYDKFEIEVIAPVINLDDFHKGDVVVKRTLTENTVDKLHDRTNTIADGKPYTSIISHRYDYINPNDKLDKTSTYWTIIIYGEAGQDLDLLRDRLAEFILKDSDYDRSQWEKILPDLFIPTEYYICPMWTKFATVNLALKGGIHSPLLPYREIIPWAEKTMHGYEKTHLENYTVAFSTLYKSIAVVACGHKKNRLAPIEFEKQWVDFANISTLSRDFNRISPETQEFIMTMNELFLTAETMTPDTEIPPKLTRIRRGEMYYVTKTLNGVSYIVPLRYNFLAEIATGETGITNIVIPQPNPEGSGVGAVDITPRIQGTPGDTHRGREAAHG